MSELWRHHTCSQDHKIVQAERGLVRSLVQPPAQAVRPDQLVQDFIQFGLKNLQGQTLHNASGKTHPIDRLPSWWSCFFLSYTHSEPLFFQFSVFVSCLPTTHFWRAWLCAFDNLVVDAGGLQFSPEAIASLGWTSPSPSTWPCRPSDPGQPSWGPFTEAPLIYPHLSSAGEPELVTEKQVCSNEHAAEGCDHLPGLWSSSYRTQEFRISKESVTLGI